MPREKRTGGAAYAGDTMTFLTIPGYKEVKVQR